MSGQQCRTDWIAIDPANPSPDNRRRGLAVRFIGPDIRYAMHDGVAVPMQPYFRDLAPDLMPGDCFRGPLFPVLWPRAAEATKATQ